MSSTSKSETSSCCLNRRDFVKGTLAAGAVVGGGFGAFYFGYDKAIGNPLRIGVIGTGDEGGVLIGALNPEFFEVRAIADIRPYSIWRAFHGDHYSDAAQAARPGLLAKYGWKNETEARRHVKVYEKENGNYEELIKNAKRDGVEAVVIATPLHLHARVAIAAMEAGLHVLTEKLMARTIGQCKAMARTAEAMGRLLAVGHQRHYNLLYAQAVEAIRRGALGELHYIRAQWNRGNLPGNDSWQPPLPHKIKPDDAAANDLSKKLKQFRGELEKAVGKSIDDWRVRVEQVEAQMADEIVAQYAKKFGYSDGEIVDANGKVVYKRPAAEELIRWRLWDSTGAGLMAELGSHQLDAAGIFIHAEHLRCDPDAAKPHPLNVAAVSNRVVFPAANYPLDRDCEDHVYCIVEFPAPGYDPKDPIARLKKIGVQYASINGNGFGGYGEMVFGTQGTLILEKEQNLQIIGGGSAAPSGVKVSGGGGGPTMDTQASGPPPVLPAGDDGGGGPAAGPAVSRGYAEELEHWAWCIRNPDPRNQPRCGPKTALADAVIALVTNMAARAGGRVEFREEWFDVGSDETPEGFPPEVRAKA